MGRLSNPSPCCKVRSHVRQISMETDEIVLRCCGCGMLRIEPLARSKPTKSKRAEHPHLRLIVNR